jgi:hypothetical protein
MVIADIKVKVIYSVTRIYCQFGVIAGTLNNDGEIIIFLPELRNI